MHIWYNDNNQITTVKPGSVYNVFMTNIKDSTILRTERLVLRPWTEDDAPALFEYAKDPRVGPITGWPVHTDVENSRAIIKDVLSGEETYAIVPIGGDSPVGSIGLMIGNKSNIGIPANDGEIGFWIGVPYWGQGLVPEATLELMRYGFEDLGLDTIWCGYFDGNEKSKRAQEKCGFKYHHTDKDILWPLMNDIRTLHITCMAKPEWEQLQDRAR